MISVLFTATWQVNQAIPSFISSATGPPSAPLPVVPAANLRFSEKPELKRLEMLGTDGAWPFNDIF